MTPTLLAVLLELKLTLTLMNDIIPSELTPFIINLVDSPIDSTDNIEFATYISSGCEEQLLKPELGKQLKLIQGLFFHIMDNDDQCFTKEQYNAIVDILHKYLTKDNGFNVEFLNLTDSKVLDIVFVTYFSLSLNDKDCQRKLKNIAVYLLDNDDTKHTMIKSKLLLEEFITNICSLQQNFIVSFVKDSLLIKALKENNIDCCQMMTNILSNFCNDRKMALQILDQDMFKDINEDMKYIIFKGIANNFNKLLPESLFKRALLACAKKPAEETANLPFSEEIETLRPNF